MLFEGRLERLAIERANLVAGNGMPARLEHPRVGASEPPSAHDIVAVFTDMRGFTKASEQLAPDVLVKEVLDLYIQAMTEAEKAGRSKIRARRSKS